VSPEVQVQNCIEFDQRDAMNTVLQRMDLRRVGIITLALGAMATAQAGTVLDRIKAKGKVVIAHRESSVPFSYYDANKKPVGYAIDLCLQVVEAVQRKLGGPKLSVTYLPVTSSNRIAAIADGQADLECGSTTNNAERRQKVAFTVPHYIAGARLLVSADQKFSELPQFKGLTVVSTAGSTPMKKLVQLNTDHLWGLKVVEAPDHIRALEMVEKGDAQAFLMDDVLLYGLAMARPDPRKLKVVGKFLTIEPLAIMLSKDDADFKRVVDDEMKRLIVSREAYTVFERWFNKPIPPTNTAMNLPMSYLLKDFWKYPSDKVPD
jgi:ABC-type amino acid transport substrate-binding protein